MTTLPEEAVKAYIKAFGNTPRTKAMAVKNEQKVRHALTAALPFLIKRERDLAERQLTDVVDRMSDDYLALKSQVVELSKDAARYRYLRNGSISDLPYDDHGCGPEFPTGHDLDAAVDAKIISADPNLQSGEPE
ncbi:hypothetical protein R5W60_16605 [Brucella pseudintermedia]|uniref:hypothetical protein n=1 Tax=Brucella pseudintermedia TaxID=370111 RepID=UPI00366E81C8|nr:hypothetical protein R5W60_16605 [Brucella pseudintermedia]